MQRITISFYLFLQKKLHLNSKMQNALWNWEKNEVLLIFLIQQTLIIHLVTKPVSAQSGITLSGTYSTWKSLKTGYTASN